MLRCVVLWLWCFGVRRALCVLSAIGTNVSRGSPRNVLSSSAGIPAKQDGCVLRTMHQVRYSHMTVSRPRTGVDCCSAAMELPHYHINRYASCWFNGVIINMYALFSVVCRLK